MTSGADGRDDVFENVYADEERARSYAGLEYPGTYWLAFRDIPGLLDRHVRGTRALDFGCGAGRSSRFLAERGFEVVGVDISGSMLARARERDPGGRYVLVPDGDLGVLEADSFDLAFCAFTFDNVPGREHRARIFRELSRVLAPGGVLVNLVSAPEIYLHEWVSFSTRDFPENRAAGSGDRVRIVMLDVPDRRPVEDVLWLEGDYRELCAGAGLELVEVARPLGGGADPIPWGTEATVSPWAIYVARAGGGPG